jgi:hypothetical protein
VRLLGNERHRRRHHHVGNRRDFLRGGLGRLDEARDHLRGGRQDQHPADDLRDLVQPQPEARGDAEVAFAPADRPEEVRLALRARLHNLAIGGDHLGRKQVVDRQPVLPNHEADSARERDPADSDRGGVAQTRGTPPLADGVRVLARCQPGLNPRGVRVGVDIERAHTREIDHDPTFAGSVARTAVAAAADGQLDAALPGEHDDASNIIRAGDPRHRRRAAIDPLEDDLACLVVCGIVWADHLTI